MKKTKSPSGKAYRYRLNPCPGQRPPSTTRTRAKSKSLMWANCSLPIKGG